MISDEDSEISFTVKVKTVRFNIISSTCVIIPPNMAWTDSSDRFHNMQITFSIMSIICSLFWLTYSFMPMFYMNILVSWSRWGCSPRWTTDPRGSIGESKGWYGFCFRTIYVGKERFPLRFLPSNLAYASNYLSKNRSIMSVMTIQNTSKFVNILYVFYILWQVIFFP